MILVNANYFKGVFTSFSSIVKESAEFPCENEHINKYLLVNVTEEVTIHRPNVSTLLSSAFIRGDLNAATRGPFI